MKQPCILTLCIFSRLRIAYFPSGRVCAGNTVAEIGILLIDSAMHENSPSGKMKYLSFFS